MAKYKIIQDHERCIGCGACITACNKNWAIGDDGKAKPERTEITEEEYECNKKAADVCPVKIIKIKKIE
ncbi:MAG: ferredoxin [Candidatus Pacearchaeota archaeon]|nr:MAG: ferredoxin [Candidatus Pacearchaeota archaeon]